MAKTTPTWSGNFTTETAKTVSLPRDNSAYRHQVELRIGAIRLPIASTATTSVSVTVPDEAFDGYEFAATLTGTLVVTTLQPVSGGVGYESIGSVSKSLTATLRADVKPTVLNVAWSEQNATVRDNIGAYIKTLSKIKGVVDAMPYGGQGSSPIASTSLSLGGASFSPSSTISPTAFGTLAGSGTAVDARGRSASKTANLAVLDYIAPQVTMFAVERATSAGVFSETGQYLNLKLLAFIKGLTVGGIQKNSFTIKVSTRPRGGAWTARQTISAPSLSYNEATLITGGGIFLISVAYEVQIVLTDKAGGVHTAVTTVPTASVTLDLKGVNVGVGKYHERGALDVAGDIYSNNFLVPTYGKTRILHTSSGQYFTDNQPITFSELVSDQLNGIVFVWSRYISPNVSDTHWNFSFIHKSQAARGGIVNMPIIFAVAASAQKFTGKIATIYNDRADGHSINGHVDSGSRDFVLRYVYGV